MAYDQLTRDESVGMILIGLTPREVETANTFERTKKLAKRYLVEAQDVRMLKDRWGIGIKQSTGRAD